MTGLQPATRRRLDCNVDVDPRPLIDAVTLLRSMFRNDLAGSVLVCPTVRHEPPRLADVLADDAVFDAANASTLRTTMVLSYLGACGVSLPMPGIAAGLLLSAADGDDGALLDTAGLCSRLINHGPDVASPATTG